MKNIDLSAVIEEDLAEILALARKMCEHQVFPTLSAAGRESLFNSLEESTREIVNRDLYQAFKIRAGARLAGFVVLRQRRYLAQLFVDSDFQGQGLGTLLLDKVVDLVVEPRLKVRASINSVDFYRKYGFVPTGEPMEVNNIKFMPMEYVIPAHRQDLRSR